MIVASKIDEKTLKRDGVCAASLPTTMGIVAGFLVQNTLKYLLQFGNVTNYLGYSALDDYFPILKLKPNPNCEDSNCRQRQKEYAEKPKPEVAEEAKEDDQPLHEDNEWGISLVDESLDTGADKIKVAEGVQLAYTIPKDDSIDECQEATSSKEVSLDELMNQIKNI